MDDKKTSKDNLTPDNTEAEAESIPEAKKNTMEDILGCILLIFIWWGIPIIGWVVLCGSSMFAPDHTSRWSAILIGLLVGSIVLSRLLWRDSSEMEKGVCSAMLIIVGFILLSTIRDYRHRAIHKQRSQPQQETKRHR